MLYAYARMRLAVWRKGPKPPRPSATNGHIGQINDALNGYPHNHNYHLINNTLVPAWQLFKRAKAIASLYPDKINSLLDISSCKGYYVLDAAIKNEACRAVGVDVYEPFVAVSNQVKNTIGIENALFCRSTLDEIVDQPGVYRPFQVILFLGSYHYFYWGSVRSSHAFCGHHEILSRIARLCSERVILAGRLEIDRLPQDLREKAKSHGSSDQYNTSGFLEAAKQYFAVARVGRLGKDDLYVLTKTQNQAQEIVGPVGPAYSTANRSRPEMTPAFGKNCAVGR